MQSSPVLHPTLAASLTGFLALSSLVACGQPTPTTEPATRPTAAKEGGNLVIVAKQEGDGLLFPLFTAFTVMGEVLDLVYDPLIRLNDKAEYVPALAKEVPTAENGGISNDGLTYIFNLRRDVKFHDGQLLTCKDVEFTYLTGKNPKVNVRYRIDFDVIESVSCRDDYTAAFRLAQPYLPFLITAANYSILPKHILEKDQDVNTTQLLQRPLGTGPFVFKERVPSSHVVLERNPNYFHGRPYLDGIVWRVIEDVNTALAQAQRGEVDIWSDFPAPQIDVVKGLKEYDVLQSPVLWQEFMSFNLLDPRLGDKRLRQALAYGTDRNAISELVYRGVNRPNPASPLVPTNFYFKKDVKDYQYDQDRARALLDEAGWKPGADGIRVKDGERLSIALQVSTAAVRVRSAELIVDQWRKIGVEGKIRSLQTGVTFRNLTQHEFETGTTAYPQFNEVDLRVLLHSKESSGGTNYSSWRNQEVDKLLDEAAVTVDRERKRALYNRIQDIFADELPYLPLFQQGALYAVKKNVHNFRFNPNRDQMKSDYWNAYEIWKE